MFKIYIERVIRNYLNSPSFGSPTDVSNRQHDLFDGNHQHLSVRKITNGFLMAYNDGGEIIYCATEKDLADQIIARAARSKMYGETQTPKSESFSGIGINTGSAQLHPSNLYNNLTAGKL